MEDTSANGVQELAKKAVGLIDLTNLNDDCAADDIVKLCEQAHTPAGPVAAVCVWPRFVGQAVRALDGSDIRVATVVNFPDGGDDVRATMHETKQCVADGAHEIDLVMPYRAFASGDAEITRSMISTIRATTDGSALLKVILETGELKDATLIADASVLALAEGADFIKTSTGKVAVNATLDAARIMLDAIKSHGDRARGFKPAGGIRTTEDAQAYLALASEIMGQGWATNATFRFGASSLLGNLLATLDLSDIAGSDSAY
ncbi:MAG: deoxyribose-phosphate aldolase [Pseudomonadota bacterium]